LKVFVKKKKKKINFPHRKKKRRRHLFPSRHKSPE
jgi:hypothetical protein